MSRRVVAMVVIAGFVLVAPSGCAGREDGSGDAAAEGGPETAGNVPQTAEGAAAAVERATDTAHARDATGSTAVAEGSGAVGAPRSAESPRAVPEPGLEGTEWRLFALPGTTDRPVGAGAPGPGATDMPFETGATLLLDRERGLVSGSTGCRPFQGAYELTGARLALGLSDLGGGTCAPGAVALEAGYLAALRDTGSWRLRADTLELIGERGVVARFHP